TSSTTTIVASSQPAVAITSSTALSNKVPTLGSPVVTAVSRPRRAQPLDTPTQAVANAVASSTIPLQAPTTAQVKSAISVPLPELDKKIADKKAEIEAAEKGLKSDAARMEAELTRIETATSRSLLGEIYKRVQDVARSEGVSVIIDKKSILYGNGAVDL